MLVQNEGMGCFCPIPALLPTHTGTSHWLRFHICPFPSPQQLFPDQGLAVLLLPRQYQDKPISNTQVATALHLPVWRELGAESQGRKHLVPKEKKENTWLY